MAHVDAWLNSTSRSGGGKGRAKKLDYARFEKIVDSDDEDELPARGPPIAAGGPLGEIPPQLQMAYAKLQMAQQRGDAAAMALATRELEARLAEMPEAFKRQLQPHAAAPPVDKDAAALHQEALRRADAARTAIGDATSRAKEPTDMRATLSKLPESEMRTALDAQLKELERAQSAVATLSEKPEALPEWLAGMGISAAEVAEAEAAPDHEAAMARLAEKAMRATLGDGPLGNGSEEKPAPKAPHAKGRTPAVGTTAARTRNSATATPVPKAAKEPKDIARARAALELQQKKAAEAAAELRKQQEAAEKAAAQVARATAALEKAEAAKAEQGRVVDESAEGARENFKEQAAVYMEDMVSAAGGERSGRRRNATI